MEKKAFEQIEMQRLQAYRYFNMGQMGDQNENVPISLLVVLSRAFSFDRILFLPPTAYVQYCSTAEDVCHISLLAFSTPLFFCDQRS